MALTKERKILIAVAGLACGIFIIDRVLMGSAMSGPQQANAAGPAIPAVSDGSAVADAGPNSPSPVAPDSGTTDIYRPTPSTTSTSLAQRLAEAGRHLPRETPNAFLASADWQVPPASAGQPVVLNESFDPRAFARRHRLDAVFASPQGAYAMVNGEALRIGDIREEMTLTDIGDRWVIWAGHDLHVKVRLDPIR